MLGALHFITMIFADPISSAQFFTAKFSLPVLNQTLPILNLPLGLPKIIECFAKISTIYKFRTVLKSLDNSKSKLF